MPIAAVFTTSPPGVTTVSPPVPVTVPYSCVEGWSPWMNIDSPTATRDSEDKGTGDYEMLWELRQYYRYSEPSFPFY